MAPLLQVSVQKFVANFRYIRQSFDVTQHDVAERMKDRGHRGWSQKIVWAVENHHRRLLFEEAISLAAIVSVPLDPLSSETPRRALEIADRNVRGVAR